MSNKLEMRIAEFLLKGDAQSARKLLKSGEASGDLSGTVLFNLKGLILRTEGDLDGAENSLLEAVKLDPGFIPGLSNLASLYLFQGRYKDALSASRQAYKKSDPKSLAVTMPYVTALLDSAQIDEALEALHALPQEKQRHRDPQLALSACLRQRGRFDEAKEILHGLLKEYPNDPTVLRVSADLMGELGVLDPIPLYERAMAAAKTAGKSNLSALRWNMSLHLLRARDFTRGWAYYEEGLSNAVGTLGRPLPTQFKQMTRAELNKIDLGKWTFVIVEQGIGDQILFLSAMDEAFKRIPKLALICEERLKPILSRSFPGIVLLSAGVIELIPFSGLPNNGFIPLGSLFGSLRPTLESFISMRRPFLRVNRTKFEKYRKALKESAKGKPIVGLSWKGGFWENQQRNKAVDLSAWESVLRRRILAVNLQYGNVKEDLDWASNQGYEVVSFPNVDFKRDLDDWLAIAAACDGIISVSTALVHFAGACNQKVAVVMPENKGPWILGLQDRRSIVYPNVHYFRKEPLESVEKLLARVAGIIE